MVCIYVFSTSFVVRVFRCVCVPVYSVVLHVASCATTCMRGSRSCAAVVWRRAYEVNISLAFPVLRLWHRVWRYVAQVHFYSSSVFHVMAAFFPPSDLICHRPRIAVMLYNRGMVSGSRLLSATTAFGSFSCGYEFCRADFKCVTRFLPLFSFVTRYTGLYTPYTGT